MKKTVLLLTTFFTFSLNAQNITWQNVNLNVPYENTEAVFNLIDGFYSNIEIPEEVRVSLWSIEYKGSSEKSTHILNFTGTKESLVEFETRKVIPEWDAYLSKLNSNPILLLDDIFDKLDDNRVKQIINLVNEENFNQIFISDTNKIRSENIIKKVNKSYKIFEIL